MVVKTDEIMTNARKSHRYFKNIGPSNDKYISENLLIDMMLKEDTFYSPCRRQQFPARVGGEEERPSA